MTKTKPPYKKQRDAALTLLFSNMSPIEIEKEMKKEGIDIDERTIKRAIKSITKPALSKCL